MPYILNEIRTDHGLDSEDRDYTLGALYLPGQHSKRFCYVLNDCERPYGVKIPGRTCIPRGKYLVDKRYSNSFKRDVLVLYTERDSDGRYLCTHGGIQFTWIQPHGGTNVDDTDGCPILSKYHYKRGNMWGSTAKKLEAIVFPILEIGTPVWWIIS